jgi:acyl-CoA thioesterase
MALDVGDAHINFNGKCHGGAVFTLAGHGVRDRVEFARHDRRRHRCAYHLPRRGGHGDTLTARAVEVSRTRRIAVYRIDVTRGDGTLVAGFTGRSTFSTGRTPPTAVERFLSASTSPGTSPAIWGIVDRAQGLVRDPGLPVKARPARGGSMHTHVIRNVLENG